jgi:hypothetical protein
MLAPRQRHVSRQKGDTRYGTPLHFAARQTTTQAHAREQRKHDHQHQPRQGRHRQDAEIEDGVLMAADRMCLFDLWIACGRPN